MNTIAEKLQAIAENERKVHQAGIRKVIEKPITELEIPEGTRSIRPYGFYHSDLTEVNFPPSMLTVNESAFEYCNDVDSLIIPSGLNIGSRAFANMANLRTVRFSGTANIDPLAFIGSGVMDIYVPWDEGEISGAPWGANNSTIHYATTRFVQEHYATAWSFEGSGGHKRKTVNGIGYCSNSMGDSFVSEDGTLLWTRGSSDTFIISDLGSIAVMYSDRVNFDFALSLNGGAAPLTCGLSTRAKYDTSGNTLSSASKVDMWKINSNGEVVFSNEVMATLKNGVATHIRTSIDFRQGKISYCDGDFNPISTVSFDVPTSSGARSANEWRKCFKNYLFYLHAAGGDSIKIHSIDITEGAVDYTLLPEGCFESGAVTVTIPPNLVGFRYGIIAFLGTSNTIIIPRTHNGTVNALVDTVFRDKKVNGGQVFLPSTITYIAPKTFMYGGFKEIFVPWSEGTNKGYPAPWGATDATIHYDYDTSGFYE